MDWERASPSEAVAEDKKNKCSPTATDLSNNNPTTGQLLSRKNKPIPPPLNLGILDLSIGAQNLTNLSLHNQNNTTNSHHNLNNNHHHHHNIISSPHCYNHPSSYLGSPKFTDSDSLKSLPYRKRWNSWSPVLMSSENSESMLPLYSDTHLPTVKQQQSGNGMTSTEGENTPQQSPSVHHQSSTSSSYPSNTGYRHPYGSINGTLNSNSHNGGNLSIQTPSPFFTPNEQSPKFMNSPVFSYSTPDTSLYQGPFSPMRSSLFPPSSPFTNLSLNTPGGPMSLASLASSSSCFSNMIPSTLLSPAPSQASTNSLSYEDLHEKSLVFTPMWNIFMSGTKVRFCQSMTMNSMDWLMVDFLAQQPNSLDPILNFKGGDYAPNGLEVRTLVVTSSSKERIQITFNPVDLNHPQIEIDCDPAHPFMVDKKGWCSVKPDIFLEMYGMQCMQLECGDVCLNIMSSNNGRSQPQNTPTQLNHSQTTQSTHIPMVSFSSSHNNTTIINNNTVNLITSSHANGSSNQLSSLIKNESSMSVEEKIVPISILPQNHHNHHQQHNNHHHHQQQQQSSHSNHANMNAHSTSGKKFALPLSGTQGMKRTKDSGILQEQKGRRPMNAFLLFAKDKRPELIQQYPGKDNRSISCLLGEAWASLAPPEKEKYSSNARARAEEQKKIHPDCWKRKRSQSTSS